MSWKESTPAARLEIFFVLASVFTITTIMFFIDQKATSLYFYFLPVLIAATLIGARHSLLWSVVCILLVTFCVMRDPDSFFILGSRIDLYMHIFAWGLFLMIFATVVGKLCEQLKSKSIQTGQIYHQLAESNLHFEEARAATILGLAKLAEYRDNETGAHIERICEYVRILAGELANHPKYQSYITNNYINDLYESSILHDIGKVAVPDKVLRKPGKLTLLEFEVIKTHTTLGGDALKEVEAKVSGQSFLTVAKEIAYSHHERWDGKGYPKGLKGDEIPLSARITALADSFDALTSKRIYKTSFSVEQTKALIIEGKGSQFDPDVVDAFLVRINEFVDVRKRIADAG
ncbi:MAG: HD domain-containing phosphohydrolase [Desulfobacteraceae bacterium]